ncbi:ABC transporter substrate binding protein [Clostridium sp. DL1XJH146]
MKKILKRTILILIFVMSLEIISITFSPKFVYAKNQKRVLVINSYSMSYPTTQSQIDGIKAVLNSTDTVIDVEFLDSKRLNTTKNSENFYRSLKYKIESFDKYDAIIACDDNALLFTVEHQEDLFNKIPIVFLGVNNVDLAKEASKNKYITGGIETLSMKETIEVALSINKEAKTIYVIRDDTKTSEGNFKEFSLLKTELENINIEEINLKNYTYEEFANKLATINKNDIVLLLSALVDKSGEVYDFYRSLDLINENCKAPIFHLWEHGIGQGCLGGDVISHYELGKQAATIVQSVFNGEKIENIQLIEHSTNIFTFDYNEMKKHDIRKSDLPSGSVIINEEVSFYKKNKEIVFTTISILVILSLIIIILIITIINRKKSEEQLKQNNLELFNSRKEIEESKAKLKSQYDRLYQYAYFDELTGLPNKANLNDKISKLIDAEDFNNKFAILFIGLDNFKIINDTFGHSVGDEVIKIIGTRLKGVNIQNKFVSRLAGDEFIILIENCNNTFEIKDEVNKIHKLFKKSIESKGNKFYVSVSTGVSLYPKDGLSVTDLLKNADAAMYKAKINGKNGNQFYRQSINEDLSRKLVIQNGLHSALENNEFSLVFQPQIDIKIGRIVGYEALIRWHNPKMGFVSPNEFIPIAEENGLIIDIGNWVLEQSCLFANRINNIVEENIVVSVNISSKQLMQDDFVSIVQNTLDKYNVNTELIELEITETSLIENFEYNAEKLLSLKVMGFRIALDDFGTGYSSLYYLSKLNIDTLKIDKSFIDDILIQDKNNLTEAIILIAHNIGLNVVAEGVEESLQLATLNKYRCDYVQGYIFSKPVYENQAIELLSKKYI